jgi:hypothetical protein
VELKHALLTPALEIADAKSWGKTSKLADFMNVPYDVYLGAFSFTFLLTPEQLGSPKKDGLCACEALMTSHICPLLRLGRTVYC